MGGYSPNGCKACAPGAYAEWTGHEQCKHCPAGKFQGKAGYADCEPCDTTPNGEMTWTTGMSGASVCVPVPTAAPTNYPTTADERAIAVAHSHQHRETTDALSEFVARGKHCEAGDWLRSSGKCEPCPNGKHQPFAGMRSCFQCVRGKVSHATRRHSQTIGPVICEAPSKSAGALEQAAAANASAAARSGASAGATTAAPVPPIEQRPAWIEAHGKESCKPGMRWSRAALKNADDDARGYSAAPGKCVPCPAGKHQPFDGQSSCYNCNHGDVKGRTSVEGAADCSPDPVAAASAALVGANAAALASALPDMAGLAPTAVSTAAPKPLPPSGNGTAAGAGAEGEGGVQGGGGNRNRTVRRESVVAHAETDTGKEQGDAAPNKRSGQGSFSHKYAKNKEQDKERLDRLIKQDKEAKAAQQRKAWLRSPSGRKAERKRKAAAIAQTASARAEAQAWRAAQRGKEALAQAKTNSDNNLTPEQKVEEQAKEKAEAEEAEEAEERAERRKEGHLTWLASHQPSPAPTTTPTAAPSPAPTVPTILPTPAPSATPTLSPTASPTDAPTPSPTAAPTAAPTREQDSPTYVTPASAAVAKFVRYHTGRGRGKGKFQTSNPMLDRFVESADKKRHHGLCPRAHAATAGTTAVLNGTAWYNSGGNITVAVNGWLEQRPNRTFFEMCARPSTEQDLLATAAAKAY
jgi:hypothetical protein